MVNMGMTYQQRECENGNGWIFIEINGETEKKGNSTVRNLQNRLCDNLKQKKIRWEEN